MDGSSANGSTPSAPTLADAIGQVVWLLGQSATHRELKIKDFDWSILPALSSGQFRLFRFGAMPALDGVDFSAAAGMGFTKSGLEQMPLGVAIWAKLSEDAEAKLDKGERLAADDWRSGDRLWLIELISPFATVENKLTELMLLDLIHGPFKAQTFSLHRTDPQTGLRHRVVLGNPSGSEP